MPKIRVGEDGKVLLIVNDEEFAKTLNDYDELVDIPELPTPPSDFEPGESFDFYYNKEDGSVFAKKVEMEILPDEVKTENQPSLEEIQTQVLLNTEYLVVMSELTNI